MEMVYLMVAIEYLQDPHHKLPFAPLSIKDPQQYYDSQYANAVRNVGDAEFNTKPISHDLNTQLSCGFLQNFISDMRENGFSDPFVRPDVVLKQDLYISIGWPIYRKYGHAYEAFILIVNDPGSILNSLTRDIKEVGPDGKEAAMRKDEAGGNEDCPVKMKLVAPPLYALTTQTIDKAFILIVNDPGSILNSLTRDIKEVGPDGKE
ncbi:hypothetical protein IFM89_037920, partial [Coptis chinensis]